MGQSASLSIVGLFIYHLRDHLLSSVAIFAIFASDLRRFVGLWGGQTVGL